MTQRSQLPLTQANVDFAPLGFKKSDEGRSIDIVRFALSIWKSLAMGLIAGCILGTLAYQYTGPTYVAETTIMVSKKASISDQEARRYGDRGEHVRVIATDVIARIAFEKHGLDKVAGLSAAKDPLKSVWEDLDVKRVAGQESSFDNIISIAYPSGDPKIAKQVVEAVVAAYGDWLESEKDNKAKALYETKLSQKTLMNADRIALEKEYSQWRVNVPYYINTTPAVSAQGAPLAQQSIYHAKLSDVIIRQSDNDAKLRSTQSKIGILKAMLANPEERESIQAYVMSSIASASSGTGSEGGGGGLVNTPAGKGELDQQLLLNRMLEQRLLLVLGENHADVVNVRRQGETLLDFYSRQGLTPPNLGKPTTAVPPGADAASEGLGNQYLKVLESRVKELQADQLALKESYSAAEKTAREAAAFEVQDQQYKDDIARMKKELDLTLKQLTDLDQNKGQEGYKMSRTNDVRVSRSIKQTLKIVGAFGILGFLAVFALAYFREWYDTTLKTVDEVRSTVGAAVMGAIPRLRMNAASERAALQNGLSPALVYHHRPGSREAEAFRSIRTTLYHCTKETHDKVIQVTSAEPGDGKSITSANLAIAIAQSGKKVLVVDADLRRPTMHTLFGLPQDFGLTDVLMNEMEWMNAVRSTRLDNLSVMTAGLCPSNPAELLSGPRLGDTLRALRVDYDVIIVDTPPILAVSDPAIIAPHVDGMLLVVRMGKNKRATAQRARESVDSHGIRLYGVIANDVDYSEDNGQEYGMYERYYNADASLNTLTREAALIGKKS